MRASEVKIGNLYWARVDGRLIQVRVDQHRSGSQWWKCKSLATGRDRHVSTRSLAGPVVDTSSPTTEPTASGMAIAIAPDASATSIRLSHLRKLADQLVSEASALHGFACNVINKQFQVDDRWIPIITVEYNRAIRALAQVAVTCQQTLRPLPPPATPRPVPRYPSEKPIPITNCFSEDEWEAKYKDYEETKRKADFEYNGRDTDED